MTFVIHVVGLGRCGLVGNTILPTLFFDVVGMYADESLACRQVQRCTLS